MDTIYALATAPGRSGVAVVRMSGRLAVAAAAALVDGRLPEARRAGLRRLFWQGDILDEALVLRFDAGASFTGEEVVELHLHGSPAVIAAVLRSLGEIEGLRPAEAGEFTRRALENGRLDLAQVEGLADLLEAETEAQRRQALRVFSGAIGMRAESWRRRLIRAAALIEATIDFADEDVPVDVGPEVTILLDGVIGELRAEARGVRAAERIRAGFEVAIIGRPNVGKSTLLNTLAGREAAITSEHAGTTRDVIEVRMNLDGLPVTFLDTAGLRETQDVVETMGIERAILRGEQADLRVFLVDAEGLPDGLRPERDDIVVAAKVDWDGEGVSGLTGHGIDRLVERIVGVLAARADGAGTMTRERHRMALVRAVGALESARDELRRRTDGAELVAEELRRSVRALDSLVGRVDVEDVLGEIFASFCIGK